MGRCIYSIYGTNKVPEDGQRSCYTGCYLRYDVNTIRLHHCKRNTTQQRYVHDGPIRHVKSCRLTFSCKHITADVWCMSQKAKYHVPCSVVLGYVLMSEEASINRVEPCSLYDWEDPAYTWKDENRLVWENIGKGFSESGKTIYCWIYCNWFKNVTQACFHGYLNIVPVTI